MSIKSLLIDKARPLVLTIVQGPNSPTKFSDMAIPVVAEALNFMRASNSKNSFVQIIIQKGLLFSKEELEELVKSLKIEYEEFNIYYVKYEEYYIVKIFYSDDC